MYSSLTIGRLAIQARRHPVSLTFADHQFMGQMAWGWRFVNSLRFLALHCTSLNVTTACIASHASG